MDFNGLNVKPLGKSNVSVNLVSRADVSFVHRTSKVWGCRVAEVDAGGHTFGEKVTGESGQVRLEGETSA